MQPHNFRLGSLYTRSAIFSVLGLSPEPRGGAWFTGYTDFGDDTFVFCNVGAAGRTGHDYANHFSGRQLVWQAKGPSKLDQPSIQRMLDRSRRVYIFHRSDDRDPFTFGGLGTPAKVFDERPVRIIWDLDDPFARPVVKPVPLAGDAPKLSQRLPNSELRKVTAEHVWRALNALRTPEFAHVYGPSTDFDAATNLGERFPPKAVFGLAATEALGFQVLPANFSSGRGHVAFEILEAAGLMIVSKGEAVPTAGLIPDEEDRLWAEGRKLLVEHLRGERASGLSQAKRSQFRRIHGRLYCEKCGMDPVKAYGGAEGEACIEVHHRATQVSAMLSGHATSLDDLQCLCANCHRVEHRRLKAE